MVFMNAKKLHSFFIEGEQLDDCGFLRAFCVQVIILRTSKDDHMYTLLFNSKLY